jgi:hypothetical protein
MASLSTTLGALRPHTYTQSFVLLQELAVITLLSYFSYLLADVTGLSGILALFVCGVVVSHYALHNVSDEGQRATLTGFRWACCSYVCWLFASCQLYASSAQRERQGPARNTHGLQVRRLTRWRAACMELGCCW